MAVPADMRPRILRSLFLIMLQGEELLRSVFILKDGEEHVLEAETVDKYWHADNDLEVHVVTRKPLHRVPLVVAGRKKLKDQVEDNREKQSEADELSELSCYRMLTLIWSTSFFVTKNSRITPTKITPRITFQSHASTPMSEAKVCPVITARGEDLDSQTYRRSLW